MPDDTIREFPVPDSGDKAAGPGEPSGEPAIVVGQPDPAGDTIDKIYSLTERFALYSVAKDGRVRHYIFEGYEKAKEMRERLSPIVSTMAVIADVIFGLRGSHIDPGRADPEWQALLERSREIQACAIRLAFEGQATAGLALLTDFKEQVERRRDSRNRMHYIFANVVALTVILVGWLAANHFGVPDFLGRILLEPVAVGTGAFRPIDVLALGALGAFFSVSAGVNAVSVNHALTMWEMVYTGFVRVPIGVLAATVAVMLIKGGWILATVQPQYMVWTMFLFGFLAGFSEAFVPNALKQVEGSTTAKTPPAR